MFRFSSDNLVDRSSHNPEINEDNNRVKRKDVMTPPEGKHE